MIHIKWEWGAPRCTSVQFVLPALVPRMNTNTLLECRLAIKLDFFSPRQSISQQSEALTERQCQHETGVKPQTGNEMYQTGFLVHSFPMVREVINPSFK